MCWKNWDQQVFIDLQKNDLPKVHTNELETSGNKGQELETEGLRVSPQEWPLPPLPVMESRWRVVERPVGL